MALQPAADLANYSDSMSDAQSDGGLESDGDLDYGSELVYSLKHACQPLK